MTLSSIKTDKKEQNKSAVLLFFIYYSKNVGHNDQNTLLLYMESRHGKKYSLRTLQ